MTSAHTHRRTLRGFTLLELIVTILVLGVLVTIGVIAYSQYTERAQAARVRTDLHQYAVAALAQTQIDPAATRLTRTAVLTALAQSDRVVTDTYTGPAAAGGVPLRLLTANQAPTGPADLALAFDAGDGTAVSDTAGTRLWLASATPNGQVYTQLVTFDGVGCSAAQQAGTVLATARLCTTKPKFVDTTSVSTVSGWPVDVTPDHTATPATAPSNGTASITSSGAVRYVSTDTFVGADAYTYTTSSGLHQVLVTVTAPTQCTTNTAGIAPLWIPSGPGSNPSCPIMSWAEQPTVPDTVVPADPAGDMTVTALASYPHSDTSYPHVIYAATSDGGVAWVQDTGPQGTTTPGGLAGCTGSTPTCRWGWLDAPGTFTSPTAAITGQGPNHGSVPAVFTMDSMFVADSRGIYVSRVNAFVTGTAPTQLLPASAYTGTVQALSGYACYSGTTQVAGNCLWFLTDTGTLGQVNVDTGAVWTKTVTVTTGSYGAFGAFKGLTTQVESGTPDLLLTSVNGDVAHVRTDGTVVSTTWQTATLTVTAVTAVDGNLAVASDTAHVTLAPTPTGGSWTAGASLTATGAPTAAHSHGVPGQMYYATSDSNACLWRVATSTGVSSQLWCAAHTPTGSGGGHTLTLTWAKPSGYISATVSCVPKTPYPAGSYSGSITTISTGAITGTSLSTPAVHGVTYSCTVTTSYRNASGTSLTATSPATSVSIDAIVDPTMTGSVSNTTLSLTWSKPTDYNSATVACVPQGPYPAGSYAGSISTISTGTLTANTFSYSSAVHGVTYNCTATVSYSYAASQTRTTNTVTLTPDALINPTMTGSVSNTTLSLTWSKPTDYNSATVACVPQGPYPAGSYAGSISTISTGTLTANTFSYSSAVHGVTYNCTATVSYSNAASQTRTTNTVALTPDALINPTMTGSVSNTTLSLTWSKPTDYNSATVACVPQGPYPAGSYAGSISTISTGTLTANTFSYSSAVHGVTYNCTATVSYSNAASQTRTTNTVTLTPVSVVAPTLSGSGGGTSLSLAWDAPVDYNNAVASCVPTYVPPGYSASTINFTVYQPTTSWSGTKVNGATYDCTLTMGYSTAAGQTRASNVVHIGG